MRDMSFIEELLKTKATLTLLNEKIDSGAADIDVVDYAEHALGQGSEATAVAYVETVDASGTPLWGVGTDPNIITASLMAVLAAHERRQAN